MKKVVDIYKLSIYHKMCSWSIAIIPFHIFKNNIKCLDLYGLRFWNFYDSSIHENLKHNFIFRNYMP